MQIIGDPEPIRRALAPLGFETFDNYCRIAIIELTVKLRKKFNGQLSEEDIQSIVVDALMKLYQRACSSDLDLYAIQGYAFITACRLAYKELAKRAADRSESWEDAFPDETGVPASFDADSTAVLWEMIDELPEELRQVTILIYLRDYSTTEVARELKIPRRTVAKRLEQSHMQLSYYLVDPYISISKLSQGDALLSAIMQQGQTAQCSLTGIARGVLTTQSCVVAYAFKEDRQWHLQRNGRNDLYPLTTAGDFKVNAPLSLVYAALLVEFTYQPSSRMIKFPPLEAGVLALTWAHHDDLAPRSGPEFEKSSGSHKAMSEPSPGENDPQSQGQEDSAVADIAALQDAAEDDMQCFEVQEQRLLYVEQADSVLVRQIDRHLEGCAFCRAAWDQSQRMSELIRQTRPANLEVSFWDWEKHLDALRERLQSFAASPEPEAAQPASLSVPSSPTPVASSPLNVTSPRWKLSSLRNEGQKQWSDIVAAFSHAVTEFQRRSRELVESQITPVFSASGETALVAQVQDHTGQYLPTVVLSIIHPPVVDTEESFLLKLQVPPEFIGWRANVLLSLGEQGELELGQWTVNTRGYLAVVVDLGGVQGQPLITPELRPGRQEEWPLPLDMLQVILQSPTRDNITSGDVSSV